MQISLKKQILIGILFMLLALPIFAVSAQPIIEYDSRVKPDKPGKPDPNPDPDPDPEGITADRIALCIGISDYEGTSSDLSYCDDDAQDWADYLESEGYTVKIILDNECTWEGINDALTWLAASEDEAGDGVVITYSGHGYYDRTYRESCFVTHDLYGFWETEINAITKNFDSQNVFFFTDACNQGTMNKLQGIEVMAIGSQKNTYTYDGTAEMSNGIFTYYAMEAISLGYYTAEAISQYAIDHFNAATPGRAFLVDYYSGELDI